MWVDFDVWMVCVCVCVCELRWVRGNPFWQGVLVVTQSCRTAGILPDGKVPTLFFALPHSPHSSLKHLSLLERFNVSALYLNHAFILSFCHSFSILTHALPKLTVTHAVQNELGCVNWELVFLLKLHFCFNYFLHCIFVTNAWVELLLISW